MVPMHPDEHKKQRRASTTRQVSIAQQHHRGEPAATEPPYPAFAAQQDPKTMERWGKRYSRVANPATSIAHHIRHVENAPLETSMEEKRYRQSMYHRHVSRHEDRPFHYDDRRQWAAPLPRYPGGHWIVAERQPRSSSMSRPKDLDKPSLQSERAAAFQAPYWNWKSVQAIRDKSQVHIPCERHLVDGTNEDEHPRVIVAVSNEESPPPSSNDRKQTVNSVRHHCKRNISPSPEIPPKRVKPIGGLDLLVMASMEVAPMKEGPPGCSCPKSRCVALYCDCFKAGRRCEEGLCTCVKCKNTIDESGPHGARTLAIRSILARNPRAFSTTTNSPKPALEPGKVTCNCVRSRCLKLYCTCFQKGKECKEGVCSCVGCLNTKTSTDRQFAIQALLQKRPDAFDTRVKEVGLGCACKNNRCIRKYCECFRNSLACTEKCTCANCKNQKVAV